MKIDLNCDLGESFGEYELGNDTEILKVISSANIACGWHAGDPMVMEKTLKSAKNLGVNIGAHPGYPNFKGFLKSSFDASIDELKAYVIYQLGAMSGFCKINGVEMTHLKLHGAMYHETIKDKNRAVAVIEAIKAFNDKLAIICQVNSEIAQAAERAGMKVIKEVFIDRNYDDSGNLIPMNNRDSLIYDEDVMIKRAIKMVKENKVVTVSGNTIEIVPDTICIHADRPNAVNFVKSLASALEAEGIEVAPTY